MTVLKKLLSAIIATVTGVTIALSAGAPAQAALSDCTAYSNVVCAWKYDQAGGSIWRQTTYQIPTTTCRKITESGWNNAISSFRNNTSPNWVWQLYNTADCTYTPYEAYYGVTYELNGSGWDNVFSSMKLRLA